MVDGDIEACWLKRDGDDIEKGEIFCYMRGSARGIFRASGVDVEFYATHERDNNADEKDERTSETGENFRDEENGTGFTGHR